MIFTVFVDIGRCDLAVEGAEIIEPDFYVLNNLF
jgi:hypothetical protein